MTNLSIIDKCVVNKVLDKEIFLHKRIGSPSKYGEVFNACYLESCKRKLAVKVVILQDKDIRYLGDPDTLLAVNRSMVWLEVLFLRMCSLLYLEKIAPQFPLLYTYYVCNDCSKKKDSKSKKSKIFSIFSKGHKDHTCIRMVTDLAEGDLFSFIEQHKPTVHTLIIVYFQIFVGLYVLYRYFRIIHNDLHLGNILWFKTNKITNTFIKYKIGKHQILLPDIGYRFIIWDFGLAKIKGKIDNKQKHLGSGHINKLLNTSKQLTPDPYGNNTDYKKIISMLFKGSESETDGTEDTFNNTPYDTLGRQLYYLFEKSGTTRAFIINLGEQINNAYPRNSKSVIKETYNLDKAIPAKSMDPFIKKFYSGPV